MKKTCKLCGGKLVNNVCVECGLDNSKSDEMYVTGSTGCEHEPLTHVHSERESPMAGKTLTREEQPQLKQETVSRLRNRTRIILAIAIIFMLIQGFAIPIFGRFVRMFTESEEFFGYGSEEIPVQDYDTEYLGDPYENAVRELSDVGEYYVVTLEAGIYKGGVHIPEGTYRVEAESGTGSLSVEDSENNIYLDYTFDTEGVEGTAEAQEDIRIYRGAIIEIDNTVVLIFQTDNAQMDLVNMLNPLTESYTLSESFTAGAEIPAGVYDIECIEGSGIVDYEIRWTDDYTSYKGKLIGAEGSMFPNRLRNLVFAEGTEVRIDGMTVVLTPSEIIESEDYDSFYPALFY